ncbi:MAG: FAD-dependent oxidoreductase [Propionibacteriaceae bacterium]|nr:FAD-dependent oxidoreductase [Propionibacteriaceae bacterium]
MDMDVIVIGAGYAGLLAANRMARRARVLLIDRRDKTVDRIRLHQLVAGTRHVDAVARPLRARLHRRASLVRGEVVDVSPGRVQLADGREFSASHIVLACGRGVARPGSLDSLEAALAVRDDLSRLRSGTVEVIGAGLTGIETATEIAAARPGMTVRLVHRDLPDFSPATMSHLMARLDQLGIELTEEARGGDLTIDATGPDPEPLTGGGLTVDPQLRLLRDGVPQPGVWGAGDAVRVTGHHWLHRGCASAMPMGATVADAVLASLAGKEPRPFDFGFDKRLVSLGRGDGSYEPLHPDGSPTGRATVGRLGAVAKEVISRAAWTVPARFARLYGPAAWARGPR